MMTRNGNVSGKGTRKAAKNERRIKTTTILIRRFPPRRVSSRLACAALGILLLIFDFAPHNPTTHRTLFADAFANNLVETGIGCMMELSTDEVIMNEEVKPAEKSDFPKMHLAVLDGSDKPIETKTFQYDPTIKMIQIAFVNPYTTSEFNDDLQFVIEIEGPTEDSRAAEFVSGGSIGCDNNKRVSGRLLDSQAAVVLQINDPAAKLRVWGGWATGHNAVRLLPDLVLEPGESGSLSEKNIEEESLEELKEELREEEFRNTDKEKLLREHEEEKLEKLLNGDEPEKQKQQDERILPEEIKETSNKKDGLQRKRKNLLEKPSSVPEGLIDPGKRDKDMGLEIARKDTNIDAGETKTIPQQLKDKKIDLEPNNNRNTIDRQKKRQKLTDHTSEHRQRRDIPETVDLDIFDDGTDDDLPKVAEPEIVNDDFLPPEVEIDDVQIHGNEEGARLRKGRTHLLEQERILESSQHFLACSFFVASMTLILTVFRKKRDKGRRDL